MCTNSLYLVTYEGERHEDHIPYGVLTFDKLKEKFPGTYKESDFKPNEWKHVCVLNLDFKFSKEEIVQITSSEKEFNRFEANILGLKFDDVTEELAVDENNKFIRVGDDCYNGEFITVSVVLISPNEKMDIT